MSTNIEMIIENNNRFFSLFDISSFLFGNQGFSLDVENYINNTKKKITCFYNKDEILFINGYDLYKIFDTFKSHFSSYHEERIQEIKNNLKSIGIYKSKRRWNSYKLFIMYRQQYQCDICQKLLAPNCEMDHKIALHKNGVDELSNIRALCSECHSNKTYQEKLNL